MIKRVHTLTNTFSGIAGEARVAAEFVRCGLRVAKPYWSDDEVDLIVFSYHDKSKIIPIPIQVKSIQFLPSKSRAWNADRRLSGIKKKYLENNPALCLAIYRPDLDEIYFIDGPKRIIELYDDDARKTKIKFYEEIKINEDVGLGFKEDFCSNFDKEWKIPKDDASWLPQRITRIAKEIEENQQFLSQIQNTFFREI